MIKKFAYTFFFGYLETKWKRLARVLSFAFFFIFLALFLYFVFYDDYFDDDYFLEFFKFLTEGSDFIIKFLMPPYVLVTSIISWVIKPFMVDK